MTEQENAVVIVMPAYNEQATIAEALQRTREAVPSFPTIVVDDGSTDATAEVAANYSTIVTLPRNAGYGAAVRAGFEAARRAGARTIVLLDADLQHPPEAIPMLLRAHEESGSDATVYCRFRGPNFLPSGVPLTRFAGNVLLADAFQTVTSQPCHDLFSGFYAIDVERLGTIPLQATGYEFPLELWFSWWRRGYSRFEFPGSAIYNDPTRNFNGRYDSEIAMAAQMGALFRQYGRITPQQLKKLEERGAVLAPALARITGDASIEHLVIAFLGAK